MPATWTETIRGSKHRECFVCLTAKDEDEAIQQYEDAASGVIRIESDVKYDSGQYAFVIKIASSTVYSGKQPTEQGAQRVATEYMRLLASGMYTVWPMFDRSHMVTK